MPDGVIDFDADCGKDPFQVGIYAEDIFAYYKRREGRFTIQKYLEKQPQLNKNMRAILVDWMVEVQVSVSKNFELVLVTPATERNNSGMNCNIANLVFTGKLRA
jgi:hypothetical protein